MVRVALVSFTLLLAGCGEPSISPPSDAQPESLAETSIATSTGEPDVPHASTEWQIWAYSTASPSFISGNAAVVDGANSVLREGTNAWTCLPANPRGMSDPGNGWNDAHEAMPLCADEEGADRCRRPLVGNEVRPCGRAYATGDSVIRQRGGKQSTRY